MTQWVKVVPGRGFWHQGKAWGDNEVFAIDDHQTAAMLRGNGSVVFVKEPPVKADPQTIAPQPAVAPNPQVPAPAKKPKADK